jgi:hypothetical protein
MGMGVRGGIFTGWLCQACGSGLRGLGSARALGARAGRRAISMRARQSHAASSVVHGAAWPLAGTCRWR